MRVPELIRQARRPVALTGAGISAPSGIPTFQGLYKGRPMRDFLSRDYCLARPETFYELYCDMVRWTAVEPNAAHRKLAALGVPVITQNIDGLHTKAGSKDVAELHGSLRFLACTECGGRVDAGEFAQRFEREGLSALSCPKCGGLLDSDVVLYGDPVRELDRAIGLAEACDLMVVVGTSLTTYPAAGLPDLARQSGARIVRVQDCIPAFAEEGDPA